MTAPARTEAARRPAPRAGERGYALVALLALMTVVALYATAAAPNILQQHRRELEREAIVRGEEVADAIEAFRRLTGRLPNSMEELLEGANPQGRTKKVRVLRAYAQRDPLARTEDGEWGLVQPRGKEIAAFQRDLMEYLGGRPVPPSPEPWKNEARAGLINFGGAGGARESGGEEAPSSSDVPFVGVVSRNPDSGVVNYFGISKHNGWVFTPIYR